MDAEVQVLDQRLVLGVGESSLVKDDLTPAGFRKRSLRLLLFLHVHYPEHPLGGGFDMGQVRKPRGDLLQRRRKLPGKQHNGHHSPHAHAPAHDQPSANEVDADIGHGVGKFDQRLHDRAGKVGL